MTVGAYLRESLAFISQPQAESWPTNAPHEATFRRRGAGVGMAFLSAYTTEGVGGKQGGRVTQGVATTFVESTSQEPRSLEGAILGSIAPRGPVLLTVTDEEKTEHLLGTIVRGGT